MNRAANDNKFARIHMDPKSTGFDLKNVEIVTAFIPRPLPVNIFFGGYFFFDEADSF